MEHSRLSVKNLSKWFGNRYLIGDGALSGLDFEAKPGEVIAIVGRNGAGKSTLLNSLSGLLAVDSGTIKLDGQDVTDASTAELANLGVARTFQLPRTVDRDNGLEALTGLQRRQQLLPAWQVPSILRPGEQAGPVRERLRQLSLAINLRPRLLLLDEPLVGLPAQLASAYSQILYECKRHQCTVLLVEHQLERVLEWADRVLFLENGSKQLFASPDQVWQDKNFRASMLRVGDNVESSSPAAGSPLSADVMATGQSLSVTGLKWIAPDGFRLEVREFTCGPGLHQIVGGTGAGKSAFLAAIVGFLPTPPRFDYLCLPNLGPQSSIPQLHVLARGGIRYLPELSTHVSCLSVADVLRFARGRARIGDVQLHGGFRVQDILKPLTDYRKRREKPHQLSGGQRQMLSLVRAFLWPANCMLLDRPLQHLDSGTADVIARYIVGIASRIPVIITGAESHSGIMRATRSWWAMNDGRLVQTVAPQSESQS